MEIRKFNAELDRALLESPAKDITIPPCPELLRQLRQVIDSRDPDPADLSRIASADVALAAGLLKTANSPLFARSRNADTVEQAIAMLGLSQSAQVLTGFLTRNAIRVNPGVLNRFWETSHWRALACEYVARQIDTGEPGIAHTFGLFCHVGMPIMMQSLKGYSSTLVEAWARQDRSFTATENAVHRTDHAVVGAIVARAWHLPMSIAVAVRLHHDFDALSDPRVPRDVATLVAIGLVTEQLVQAHLGLKELLEWQQFGTQCLDLLQADEAEMDYWANQLYPVFEQTTL